MTLTPVSGGRHVCQLPQFMDRFDDKSGQVFACDDCGRFWRLWMGSHYHEWERVSWWESRKIRRAQSGQSTREQP